MRRALVNLGVMVVVSVVLLAMVEGCASFVLVALKLREAGGPVRVLAERRHTRYDAELGWVNLPNVRIEDMYGPGVALTTNAQGFRGTRDVAPAPPPGVARIVCLGDSFTLGYGVADDETWCRRLRLPGREIETINMGQGGYGLDQAYLWYRRDGMALAADLLIFAFVHADLNRLKRREFLGYAKPRLRVHDGELVTENVPVPRLAYRWPWLARNLGHFATLRVARLAARVRGPRERGDRLSQEEADRVTDAIFDALAAHHGARGTAVLFVYLPTQADLAGRQGLVRARLQRRMAAQGHPYLDLTGPMAGMARSERARLFIQPGATTYFGAAGHYTPFGNEVVARLVSEALARPPLAGALRAAGGAD